MLAQSLHALKGRSGAYGGVAKLAQKERRRLPRCANIFRLVRYAPLLCALPYPGECQAETLSVAVFTDIAHRCGSTVAAPTLAAVAKTESGFKTLVVSDNTTRRSQTYQTVETAASQAAQLIAAGHSIDIGLMQINSANLNKLGMTVRDALDACKSISGGAMILTRNYILSHGGKNEQVALRDALSQYNTGNRQDGYRNGYVHRVERAAIELTSVTASSVVSRVSLNELPAQAVSVSQTPPSWDVWTTVDRSRGSTSSNKFDSTVVF